MPWGWCNNLKIKNLIKRTFKHVASYYFYYLFIFQMYNFNRMTISILHSAVNMVPVKCSVSWGPDVMSQFLMREETGILVEIA